MRTWTSRTRPLAIRNALQIATATVLSWLFCDGHAEAAKRNDVRNPSDYRWRSRWSSDYQPHTEISWTANSTLDQHTRSIAPNKLQGIRREWLLKISSRFDCGCDFNLGPVGLFERRPEQRHFFFRVRFRSGRPQNNHGTTDWPPGKIAISPRQRQTSSRFNRSPGAFPRSKSTL